MRLALRKTHVGQKFLESRSRRGSPLYTAPQICCAGPPGRSKATRNQTVLSRGRDDERTGGIHVERPLASQLPSNARHAVAPRRELCGQLSGRSCLDLATADEICERWMTQWGRAGTKPPAFVIDVGREFCVIVSRLETPEVKVCPVYRLIREPCRHLAGRHLPHSLVSASGIRQGEGARGPALRGGGRCLPAACCAAARHDDGSSDGYRPNPCGHAGQGAGRAKTLHPPAKTCALDTQASREHSRFRRDWAGGDCNLSRAGAPYQ